MARENPIYEWPRADAPTMLLIFLFVFGLFFLAGFAEWVRRRRDRAARRRAEWKAARQIAQERELTQDEWKLLETLIQRHHPDGPHKAMTLRQVFDEIVDAELAHVRKSRDAALEEQRGVLLRDIRNRLGLTFIPFGLRINSTRELYLDQVLWAGVDKETAEWFRLAVASVDEAFFRLVPLSERRVPPFQQGQTITFRMWRDEDARYEFQAALTSVESDPLTFVFRHSMALERLQAREHFRLNYDVNVNVGIISAPLDGAFHQLEKRPVVTRLRGRVRSLSAGGIALLVQQPVPRQVLLRLSLPFEHEAPPIEVHVRLIEARPLAGGQYLLRGAFVDMNEAEAETITHFIFRKQQQGMPAEAHQQAPVE